MLDYLTPSQVEEFTDKGCLVLDGFFDVETANALKQRADDLLQSFDFENHPKTRFSTGDKDEHIGDEYFLGSGDKIHFFFEEKAFDGQGTLLVPKERAINKIGHGLHILDPTFKNFSVDPRIGIICRQLGLQDPRMLQSMVIFKQPRIGGRVPPHQDSTFIHTTPESTIGFWFALEDCTTNNGCLSFVPGSHKSYPLLRRFIRNPHAPPGTIFDPPSALSEDMLPTEDEYIPLEIKAGSLVLLHGRLLHKSEPNTSDKSRYAYTFHVVDAHCEYDDKNWLRSPFGIRRGAQDFTKISVSNE